MGHVERADLYGAVVGARYRLGRPLGIGGTSVVFEAERLIDGAEVVVKMLRDTFASHAELIQRLRREAEVARTVSHPGIVPVLDEGILEDGSPFLVLERLEGECVARILNRKGPLAPPFVAAITVRAAAILHAAHGHGYVHRDIKPEHVVLDRTADGYLDVRILDFGVCASSRAALEEREAERGRVYGTPAYVSPEQAAGLPDVDARADVFALGTFMFEALTGRVPFSGTNVSNVLRRIIREDAPRIGLLLPDLDLRFDDVVSRAMARVPEARFPTTRALARALLPLCGDRRRMESELAGQLRVRWPRPDLAPTLVDAEPRRAVA
jgi:eukaryotic-like serine/threonine-protein kinase